MTSHASARLDRAASPASTSPAAASPTAFADEWHAWHRRHETRRTDPHGFFGIVSITWLTDEPVSIDGLPGRWSTGETTGPVIELAPGESLGLDGTDRTGRIELGPLHERAGITLVHGDVHIEVARRGGRDIVRPRDPASPFLTAYSGTPAYDPDPAWSIPARFVRYDDAEPVTVGAAVPNIHHVYDAPGSLEFEHDGRAYRLVAFPGHTDDTFFVLIRDATSGVTTYAANRSIAVPVPDAEGRTVIDFNRAVNLPCAYTDYATCPLPPDENVLPFAVEAGEKTPLERFTFEGVERAARA